MLRTIYLTQVVLGTIRFHKEFIWDTQILKWHVPLQMRCQGLRWEMSRTRNIVAGNTQDIFLIIRSKSRYILHICMEHLQRILYEWVTPNFFSVNFWETVARYEENPLCNASSTKQYFGTYFVLNCVLCNLENPYKNQKGCVFKSLYSFWAVYRFYDHQDVK